MVALSLSSQPLSLSPFFLFFQEKYRQVRYASRSPLTLISPIFMRERYIFRKYDNCFLFYGRTKMNKLEQLITKQKEI
jgi:hypothetical protein